MRESSASAPDPEFSISAIAALICATMAGVLIVMDMVSPSLSALPISPALIAACLAVAALVLREHALRTRFADQAASNAATRRAMKEQIRWLEMTEAQTNIGHWRLDLASNAVFWSDATYAIHALDPGRPPRLEDALGFYHEDDREIVVRSIDEARKTGQFQSFKARLIDAKGCLRHVDSGASVELDKNDNPVALFGVFKDRTGEEEMQAELRRASEDALALARAKGMFLARMSHEIRTPMNGLIGFAELLAQSDLDPEQAKQVRFIVESGHSLQALLKDILDFTKVEAGKVEIKRVRIDTSELIDGALQGFSSEAAAKGIRLIKDIASDVPDQFKADPLRLRQILTNLLANAVRLTVTGSITLKLSASDDALRFEVRDTGPGIEPHMIEGIFDPFTQVSSPGYAGSEGTGLGLPISRNLAELMQGGLSVESSPGQGATFILTLPLIKATSPKLRRKDNVTLGEFSPPPPNSQERSSKPQTIKVPHAVDSAPGKAPRILLAEDFEINRELIVQMAERMQIDLDCAVDGKEAVGMVHQAKAIGKPYHAVLMDLQMPNLDGIEATQRLRSAGFTPKELPIIAVTANGFADDIERCLASGMQAHLSKPMSMDQLKAALAHWVPTFRQRASAA